MGGSLSYEGRSEFRTSPGRLVAFAALSVIVLVISIAASIYEPEFWVSAICWSIFVLSIIAIADLISSYITLGDTALRMRRNFRTQVIPRIAIESVSVAKGCPIILHLQGGGQVEVPDLAVRGIGNSLRAWVKATQH